MKPVGTVIGLFRGGCEAVEGGQVRTLRLVGRHARAEQSLAVGDRVSFDPEGQVVDEVLPRRTRLARRRGRRRREHVIAANVDRLAIVSSVSEPDFHPLAVDRFALAAFAGGLEALLVVNKIDLLAGELPDEIRAYHAAFELFPTSALLGTGVDALRERLHDSVTVFAGHSGVGKSSLLNALEPELRLETGPLSAKTRRGRHTTTRVVWLELAGGAVVIDTPGVSEVGSGPVDLALLDRVYPDVAAEARACRFRDCRHGAEPDCAVRAAVETGRLPESRFASYRRLVEDLRDAGSP